MLGIDRLGLRLFDRDVDAGLSHGRLHRLRDVGIGRGVERIHLDLDAIPVAGLGEQRLGLGDVERERLSVSEAKKPDGQNDWWTIRTDRAGTNRHALVVDQIAQRLAHLGLGQHRIAHVDLEVDQVAGSVWMTMSELPSRPAI